MAELNQTWYSVYRYNIWLMKQQTVTRRRLDDILASPNTVSKTDVITIYASPGSFPGYINSISPEAISSACINEIKQSANLEVVVKKAGRYKTGAAIFWDGHENKHIVLPPFPIAEDRTLINQLDASLLLEILDRRYTIGVMLVTWGSYAVGVFDGGNLIKSKVGTGYIHKKHKKGGSSQKRFARRTEEQKKDFLRKVGNRIDEIFAQCTLDHIFFGGNRLILKPLLPECRYLESKTEKISRRILDVRRADREVLNNSLSEIMKSVVFSF